MCGSCSGTKHSGRKRWTIAHLVVLVLTTSLIALSVAGLAVQFRSDGTATGSGCSHLAVDSTAYQTTVTRDLNAGQAALIDDTKVFVEHARAEGGARCSQLHAIARDAQSTLSSICAPCAARLQRAFGRTV